MNDVVMIVTLTLPFVFVIAIVWLKNSEKQKRRQLQAELYAKALEKGQPLPSDLFAEPKQKPLNTGIILIAAGIGMSLLFWLMSIFFASIDKDASLALFSVMPVGLVPFMIGVANVIIYHIGKKKDDSEKAK
jgi:hypothetical protein